mmetsp:Transcript_18335/g.30571  ORF Transcript_18335/g.30571 Transcript_18335/m.30571 type:complete len:281 (+) Transcript_18335:33-875(+)
MIGRTLIVILAAIGSMQLFGEASQVNVSLTEPALWLCAATQCSKDEYMSRTFIGPTTGFVTTSVIYDHHSDTTGFIGYLPSDKTIFVVFRGTSSVKNTITDIDAFKTDYVSFPECQCQVHEGFYKSEQSIIDQVIADVRALQAMAPLKGYEVVVTGHSLGAAVAHLTAMDLIKNGIDCSCINFGMPRTGTAEYSSFASKTVQTLRYSHYQDIVPHVPTETVMSFYHICTEMYEDKDGSVKQCDSSCEDTSCADQWALRETNGDDHCQYLGLAICSCSAVS